MCRPHQKANRKSSFTCHDLTLQGSERQHSSIPSLMPHQHHKIIPDFLLGMPCVVSHKRVHLHPCTSLQYFVFSNRPFTFSLSWNSRKDKICIQCLSDSTFFTVWPGSPSYFCKCKERKCASNNNCCLLRDCML